MSAPTTDRGDCVRELRHSAHQMQQWLVLDAYPLWARQGVDRHLGGFHELLGHDGPVVGASRRARVQARQIYAFASGTSLGWHADAATLVLNGWKHFFHHYRRPDGLYRTLLRADGTVIDDDAFLYDQAFVLLALAQTQRLLGPLAEFSSAATNLRNRLYDLLKCKDIGFESGRPQSFPLLANPHMHLLEAAISWMSISDDPHWAALAAEIVELATTRLVAPETGAILETFAPDWHFLPGTADRMIEPGHQFEWAALLLKWSDPASQSRITRFATRLLDIGENHGMHRGMVVRTLHEDLTAADRDSRLWSQTERLKAALAMARLTDERRYWSMANSASRSVCRYLQTQPPGLWHDRLTADGRFVSEPAPASTLYHLVSAIGELVASLPNDA